MDLNTIYASDNYDARLVTGILNTHIDLIFCKCMGNSFKPNIHMIFQYKKIKNERYSLTFIKHSK